MRLKDSSGKFIGEPKVWYQCTFCNENFYSYKTRNRKFCSRNCAFKGSVKVPPSQKGNRWKHSEETKKKMRGRTASQETRLKLSICQRGENHYRWKGGVTKLTKRIRKCFFYSQWREKIFERDGYSCIFCGNLGGRLEVDHYPKMFSEIIWNNNIDTIGKAFECKELWDTENGRILCKLCHKSVTYKKERK